MEIENAFFFIYQAVSELDGELGLLMNV